MAANGEDINGYCEGDSCPPGAAVIPLAGPDCSTLQYVLIFTTGVTCVALLLDLAKRYLFSPPATKDKATLTEEDVLALVKSSREVNGNYSGFKLDFEGGKSQQGPLLSAGQTHTTRTTVSHVTSAPGAGREVNDTFDAVDSRPLTSKPLQEQTIIEADEQDQQDRTDGSAVGKQDKTGDGTTAGGHTAELTLMVDDLLTALRTSIHGDQKSKFYLNVLKDYPFPRKTYPVITKMLPENCKENATKVESLESLFTALGREVDETTLNMVASAQEQNTPAKDVLSKVEKETLAYKKCWLGLRRLLFCVDIHIRNSSHYQVFHHECDRLQHAVEKYHEELKSKTKEEEDNTGSSTHKDIAESVRDIEREQSMLKLWGDAIARLCDQSKTINPVHLRTDESTDEIAARALVNYNTENVTVNEGDIMLLIDNSDAEKWKLMTTSGAEIELPAVCCVIPAPDLNTMKQVGRIETTFKELSENVQDNYNKRLDEFSKQLLHLLSSKDLTSISKEQRKELLEQIAFLEVFLGKFHKDGKSQQMLDRFSDVRTKVNSLEDDDGDATMTELLDLFSSWVKVANIYETSVYDKEKRKLLVKQGILLDAEDTEWETLAEIEAARRELGLAVSVHRETMKVAEATKYERATGETMQRFSIKGVIDPRDNSELSMAEAIKKGIINQTEGTYYNLKTGESYPIPVAMNAGLIVVSSTKTTKARELKKAIGVITVEFKRETRPYKITHAIDPVSTEQVAINEAVDQGLFDTERQVYKNTESGEEVSIENAIDSGLLIVEYNEDSDAPQNEPEITQKTFTISSALDRKTKKQYQFDEAVERGLIDKEHGMYHDTLTDQKINIVEAIQKKFMKGRVVTNPDKIGESFLSRQRSGSVDSQASESSKSEFE